MSRKLFGLVLAVAAVFTAVPASAALTIYGLKGDGTNTISLFKSNTPNVINSQVVVTGLASGEKLVAIAFEPRTGVLFGFGHDPKTPDNNDDSGRFYVINRVTGAATALQGGSGQAAIFSNMLDYRYSGWDNVQPSFAMHIDGNSYDIKVVSWDGEVLRYDLYDGSTAQYESGIDWDDQVVASAVMVDLFDGETESFYIILQDDGQLELQGRDDGDWISDLDDGFDLNDPRVSHVGFDFQGFNGYVAHSKGGITRLFYMDLYPWWDFGGAPALSPVGIIGNGDTPMTALAILPGSGYIAIGRETGAGAVKVYNPSVDAELISFNAFGSGGARVALGDFWGPAVDGEVVGDGFPEVVVVPGAGPVASVKVFDGDQILNHGIAVQIPAGFQPAPFGAAYKNGMFVATGDLDDDGQEDIVIGTGSGAAKFKVIDPDALAALSPAVTVPGNPFSVGGARVAVGFFDEDDLTGPVCYSPQPHIIVGSGNPDAKSRVAVYDGYDVHQTIWGDFYEGWDIAELYFNVPGWTGAIFVAAADYDDDGEHFIVGRADGSPTVKIIDPEDIFVEGTEPPFVGTVEFVEVTFQAFGGTSGGARVGSGLINMLPPPYSPYEHTILVGRGPGPVNAVRGFPNSFFGFSPLFSATPFPTGYTGGVFVAGALGIRGGSDY